MVGRSDGLHLRLRLRLRFGARFMAVSASAYAVLNVAVSVALVRRHAEQTADLENRLQTADTTATAKIQMLEDELAKVDTFREMKRAMDAKIEEQEKAPNGAAQRET